MWKPKIGWRNAVALSLALLSVGFCAVFPLGNIAYNLTARARVGRQLAESLQARHPKLDFHGGAGYEGAHLFIVVRGESDEKTQKEIIDWLEQQRQHIGRTDYISVSFIGEHEIMDYRHEGGVWRTNP